ncbi:hypothetical protein [Kurthia senegalensis]|uniref:hypothetical protein n=1 Tax=Kurthia senegalensis TaxID=1033740 RepID=UPI000287B98D|nr:hypothetical protein [Kurthia senegalensis]
MYKARPMVQRNRVEGKQLIATVTRQKELTQEKLKKDIKVWHHDWFYIDDESPLTVSDVLMSIGFYIVMPVLLLAAIILVINI